MTIEERIKKSREKAKSDSSVLSAIASSRQKIKDAAQPTTQSTAQAEAEKKARQTSIGLSRAAARNYNDIVTTATEDLTSAQRSSIANETASNIRKYGTTTAPVSTTVPYTSNANRAARANTNTRATVTEDGANKQLSYSQWDRAQTNNELVAAGNDMTKVSQIKEAVRPKYEEYRTKIANGTATTEDKRTYDDLLGTWTSITKKEHEYAASKDDRTKAEYEAVTSASDYNSVSSSPAAAKKYNEYIYSENSESGQRSQDDIWFNTYATAEEKSVFRYYLVTDYKKAVKYFNFIESKYAIPKMEEAEAQKGAALGEKINSIDSGIGNAAAEVGVSAVSGVSRFFNGLNNAARALTGKATVANGKYSTAYQTAIQDDGKFAKFALGALENIANNLPSMLTGSYLGSTAGLVAMGGSVFGNAYDDAVKSGGDTFGSFAYATLDALSETSLERVLGGIKGLQSAENVARMAKISDSISSALKSMVKSPKALGIIKTLASRAANASSEALEEYLQEILDPAFKNLTLNENNDLKLVTPEAIQAGLMGALTSLVFGVSGIKSDTQANIQAATANKISSPDNNIFKQNVTSAEQHTTGQVSHLDNIQNNGITNNEVKENYGQQGIETKPQLRERGSLRYDGRGSTAGDTALDSEGQDELHKTLFQHYEGQGNGQTKVGNVQASQLVSPEARTVLTERGADDLQLRSSDSDYEALAFRDDALVKYNADRAKSAAEATVNTKATDTFEAAKYIPEDMSVSLSTAPNTSTETTDAFVERAKSEGKRTDALGNGSVSYTLTPDAKLSSTARQTRAYLVGLGVKTIVYSGDIQYNNGSNTISMREDALTSSSNKTVYLSNTPMISPLEQAGHEAMHVWINDGSAQSFYNAVVGSGDWNNASFKSFAQSIIDSYMGGKYDDTKQADRDALYHEVAAYVSGSIYNQNSNEDVWSQRLNGWDNIVKEWNSLLKQKAKTAQDISPALPSQGKVKYETYEELLEKHGAKPYGEQLYNKDTGEKITREFDMPNKDRDGNNISTVYRTIAEGSLADSGIIQSLKAKAEAGELSYSPISNKAAVDKANASIASKLETRTLDQAVADVCADIDKRATKWNIAEAEVLMRKALAAKNYTAFFDLINAMSFAPSYGAAIQAFSIIKRLGKNAELLRVQRAAANISKKMTEQRSEQKAEVMRQRAEGLNAQAEEIKSSGIITQDATDALVADIDGQTQAIEREQKTLKKALGDVDTTVEKTQAAMDKAKKNDAKVEFAEKVDEALDKGVDASAVRSLAKDAKAKKLGSVSTDTARVIETAAVRADVEELVDKVTSSVPSEATSEGTGKATNRKTTDASIAKLETKLEELQTELHDANATKKASIREEVAKTKTDIKALQKYSELVDELSQVLDTVKNKASQAAIDYGTANLYKVVDALEQQTIEYKKVSRLLEAEKGNIKDVDGLIKEVRAARDKLLDIAQGTAIMTESDALYQLADALEKGTLNYDDAVSVLIDEADKYRQTNKLYNTLYNRKAALDNFAKKTGIQPSEIETKLSELKTKRNAYIELSKMATQIRSLEKNISKTDQRTIDTLEGRKAEYKERIVKLEKDVNQSHIVEHAANKLMAIAESYGDNITLSDDVKKAIVESKSEAELDDAMHKAYAEIAAQIPATLKDKLLAWRYMCMLANPTTHIRNVLGNAAFVPMREASKLIQYGMQNIINSTGLYKRLGGEKSNSTQILTRADTSLVKAGQADFETIINYAVSTGKYNESTEIQNLRKIFNNKILERTRKLNGNLLEAEDCWFLRREYAREYARYFKGIDVNPSQATEAQTAAARARALNSAWEATYRQASATAQWLSNAKSTKAGFFVDAIVPFTKTPINILKQAINYSPAGIIKGVVQFTQALRTGTSADTAIKSLSEGFTGAGITALGFLMRSMGLLHGSNDDDDDVNGRQEFSVEIGGISYTLDWLTPAAMSLFSGVSLFDMLGKDADDSSFVNALATAGANLISPLINMSVLQGVNNAISSASRTSGIDPIGNIALTSVTQYISQFVPTVFSKLAKIIDPTRRLTYDTSKTGVEKTADSLARRLLSKFPGTTYLLEPYVDPWGNVDTVSALQATLEATVSPGYFGTTKLGDLQQELKDLYGATNDSGVLNRLPNAKFTNNGEQISLSAKQYTRYKIAYGNQALTTVQGLTNTTLYKSLSPEQQAQAVINAYDYSREFARSAVVDGYVNTLQYRKMQKNPAGLSAVNYILYNAICNKAEASKNSEKTDALKAAGVSNAEIGKYLSTVGLSKDKYNEWLKYGGR